MRIYYSIQYILNGELKVRSIGMIELLQSHTGKYIAKMIIKKLKEFGINLKQITTETTDNGKNVLKMVRDINHHLQEEIEKCKQSSSISNRTEPNENDSINENTDELIKELLAKEREITDDEALERLFEEAEFEQEQDHSTLLNAMSAELTTCGAEMWDITGVNCAAHTLQLAIHDAIKKLPTSLANVIKLVRNVCLFLRLTSTSIAMREIGIAYTLPRLENARVGALRC